MKIRATVLATICAATIVGCGGANHEEEDATWKVKRVTNGYEVVAPAPLLAAYADGMAVEVGLDDPQRGPTNVVGRFTRLSATRAKVTTNEKLDYLERTAKTFLLLRRAGSCASRTTRSTIGHKCSELSELSDVAGDIKLKDPNPGPCSGCARDSSLKAYDSAGTICYCIGSSSGSSSGSI